MKNAIELRLGLAKDNADQDTKHMLDMMDRLAEEMALLRLNVEQGRWHEVDLGHRARQVDKAGADALHHIKMVRALEQVLAAGEVTQ